MDSYRERLAGLVPAESWLGEADAVAALCRVRMCFDDLRYGLSKSAFGRVDRLNVAAPPAESRAWLEERVGRGPEVVRVVYTRDEVCEVPAQVFLDNWQTHFCPPDDEIAVLPPQGGWILCYFHEEQFEFARGGPA
jgi:hypothetical protein